MPTGKEKFCRTQDRSGYIIAKKVTLAELRQRYENKPSECNVYTIDGIDYRVVSHYTGEKDIDKVILTLAVNKAYADTTADNTAQ